MGQERKADAVNDLEALPSRGAYLDVSCGRGEMLVEAERLGFDLVHGTEIVPQLIDGIRVVRAEVHALPFSDKSFDVVTMFDVIEHLIPGDDERACRELARVARRHVLVTANNKSSSKTGVELHINRRPYETWDRLFTKWFAPARVTWIKGARNYISEGWRIDL
jgi:ubiquinone/menaquinone biosynthesis C-methylase UbiE